MSIKQFFVKKAWWGKFIGAILGYFIAGPLGVLFGILIGNFFDKGLAEHFSQPYSAFHSEQQRKNQELFFETTFAVMGHLAKADGRISEQEIKIANAFMNEMRLTQKQREKARESFNAGKQANFDLKQALINLRAALQPKPDLIKLFLDIQYRSIITGGLSFKKIASMNTILGYLGFAPLNEQYRFYQDNFYQGYSGQTSYNSPPGAASSLDAAFSILEISPTSNRQEVKRAYQKMISRNHPDKLIAQGLPESMIKMANEKTQKIRKAYEQICERKGWS